MRHLAIPSLVALASTLGPCAPDYPSVEKTLVQKGLCNQPPVVAVCTKSSMSAGVYFIVSARKWANDQRDIAMEVGTDSNEIQQMDFRGIGNQAFFIGDQDASGCFVINDGRAPHQGMTLAPGTGNADALVHLSDTNGQRVGRFQEPSSPTTCPALVNYGHWDFIPAPGGPDRFQIRNKLTGTCIDLADEERHGGGKIQTLDCRDVDNQRWSLRKAG